VLEDRRLLSYHFRGFPDDTEVATGHVLPIENQVFDATDGRPWTLRQQAPASMRAGASRSP
jgi:hypothetical protein